MALFILLFLVLVVLNISDGITTYMGLKKTENEEVNPIASWLMCKIGSIPGIIVVKVLALSTIAAGIFIVGVRGAPGVDITLSILIAVYIWVVVHNIKVIYK